MNRWLQPRLLVWSFLLPPLLLLAHGIASEPDAESLVVRGDLVAGGHVTELTAAIGDVSIGSLSLGGRLLALASGELGRRDGLIDIAAGISTARGPELVLLQSPRGALRADPRRIALPFEPRKLLIADIVGERVVINSGGRAESRPDRFGDVLVEGELQRAIVALARDGTMTVQLVQSQLEPPKIGSSPLPAPEAVRAASVVNSDGDDSDAALGDGFCDTDLVTPGEQCSLRSAIEQANATTGPDSISFAIGSGPVSLAPASPLPAITETLTIDATTQPGFGGTPLIELRGDSAGAAASGLTFQSPSCGVRGLTINRFGGSGIRLDPSATGTVITGCYLGVDPSGTFTMGNGAHGLEIDGASDNVIGGRSSLDRNLISGNRLHGVSITGATAIGNVLEGNYIGLDSAGSGAVGNGVDGVRISDADLNTVGGTVSGTRNVISGNGSSGVHLVNGSSATLIQGNYLGTDATGVLGIGNQIAVRITGAPDNTIGGLAPADCSNNPSRNLISGNGSAGIQIAGAAAIGTRIQGNLIGTQADGVTRLANAGSGIAVAGSDAFDSPHQVEVGGSQDCLGNTISFNTADGIAVGGASDAVSIRGNVISANSQQGIDLGNDGPGVNDDADADLGPNRLQNNPVIAAVELRETGKSDSRDLVIRFHVDSDPANASYPLTIEFFESAGGSNQGERSLGSREFSAADFVSGTTESNLGTAEQASVGTQTLITALATDAAGNSSEFSPTMEANLAPTANADDARVLLDTATDIPVLDNDTDLDGTVDLGSVEIDTEPMHGTVSVTSEGLVTYAPDDGYQGADEFRYLMRDTEGASSEPALVSLDVSSNQLPVAVDDSATVRQGRSTDIAVLDNDSDPDGTLDSTSLVVDSLPEHGSAVAQPDGTIRYESDTDYTGQDQFSYTVADDAGSRSAAALVTVSVTANQPPTAIDDLAVTESGMSVSITVLDNDSDSDGELATDSVTIGVAPAHGTAIPQPNGSISYEPAAGFVGDDSFSYSVADDSGARSAAAEVSITVRPQNSPPEAEPDEARAVSGEPLIVNVLLNDSDPDAEDRLTITSVSEPVHGTATANEDGTVTYTATLGYSGPDFFIYLIDDGSGGADYARVDLDVVRGPDLAGRWLSSSASCNSSGRRCRISGQILVENRGLDAARGVRVRFHLASNADCSTPGRELKTSDPRRLDPGASATLSVRKRLPRDVDPSELCLLATLDPSDVVAETHEENNDVRSNPLP